MSFNVLADENQKSIVNAVAVDCNQQALDSGIESGEELDSYIAECEMSNSESNSVEETFVDQESVDPDLEVIN